MAKLQIQITRICDFKNLCEVCKRFYSITAPILYETFVVKAKDEFALENVSIESLPYAPSQSSDLLLFVKDFHVTSPFRINIEKRCLHYGTLSGSEDYSGTGEGYASLKALGGRLMNALERLKDENLRSFTWDLGTCIPDQILSSSGYLPCKQSKLESISLTTDGRCNWRTREISNELDLSRFKCLKKLSWKGLNGFQSDFDTLRKVFQQTPCQLQELELDALDWESLEYTPYLQYDFMETVLGLSAGDRRLIFPSLQALSLSGISFELSEEQMLPTFDFSLLKSLKLCMCPGWAKLLMLATHSNKKINLKSLEVSCDFLSDDGDGLLEPFLESFDGLEELCLDEFENLCFPDIWKAMLHHKSTLKKLVHHQKGKYNWTHSFMAACLTPDTYSPRCQVEIIDKEAREMFVDSDLEFFGISCAPEHLKQYIAPFSNNNSLQVLHIRQSGLDLKDHHSWALQDPSCQTVRSHSSRSPTDPDSSAVQTERLDTSSSIFNKSSKNEEFSYIAKEFHDFAEWVFGPEGISSLQILAAGDFSNNRRYADYIVLLCRNVKPADDDEEVHRRSYRCLKDDDEALKEVLHKYLNVLEACPSVMLTT